MTDIFTPPEMPDPSEAVRLAQALLDEDKGNRLRVDPGSLVPNPLQGLWILSYFDPSGAALDGGGIVVDADGARWLASAPGAIEYVGALFPDEADESDPAEDAEVAALIDGQGVLFGEQGPELWNLSRGTQVFAPKGADVSESICVMAIPAEDDPVNSLGDEEKHATVLFFGAPDDSADPDRLRGSKPTLLEALRAAAAETPPFVAKVKRVEELGDEGAVVWMLDSPDLQRLFSEIPASDGEVASLYEGADVTRYPEYLPHVTIGYTGLGADGTARAAAIEEIRFDRLSLWWGDERHDVPLGSSEFEALLGLFDEDAG